jgi:hypothetical protein
MRLRARIQKVAAAVPRCDGRIRRVVRGEYVPSETDQCKRCGKFHVLVIKTVVVTRADLEATRIAKAKEASL